MYLKLRDLSPTHLALLSAPTVGAATVMREHDRSAMTRPARFAVDVQAGLAWAWIKNPELVAAAEQEGSLVLEQRSGGWMLQFSGGATAFQSEDKPEAGALFQARYPGTQAPQSGFQVRIHRCWALETHVPLKRWR